MRKSYGGIYFELNKPKILPTSNYARDVTLYENLHAANYLYE